MCEKINKKKKEAKKKQKKKNGPALQPDAIGGILVSVSVPPHVSFPPTPHTSTSTLFINVIFIITISR